MPHKRAKNSPSKPDPNRVSTRPKNATTRPGQVVLAQCSTRRPESIIQAEKAEKAAYRAKKEQQHIEQHEAAQAIAEYEQDMAINDAIDDNQFPRHQNKAGMSNCICIELLLCPKFLFNSLTDRGNGPTKRPNAGHRSASGTKRKIEDSKKQSFKIVDSGPEVDSGVEERPKSKRARVGTLPADTAHHSGKPKKET